MAEWRIRCKYEEKEARRLTAGAEKFGVRRRTSPRFLFVHIRRQRVVFASQLQRNYVKFSERKEISSTSLQELHQTSGVS